MIVILRYRSTLTKSAVPTIFPNCPSYMTNTKGQPERFSTDDKELTMVQTAINLSLVERRTTSAKFSFTSLTHIVVKLSCISLYYSWLSTNKKIVPYFLETSTNFDNHTCIQCSLVIVEDLIINYFHQQKCQIYLSLNKFRPI